MPASLVADRLNILFMYNCCCYDWLLVVSTFEFFEHRKCHAPVSTLKWRGHRCGRSLPVKNCYILYIPVHRTTAHGDCSPCCWETAHHRALANTRPYLTIRTFWSTHSVVFVTRRVRQSIFLAKSMAFCILLPHCQSTFPCFPLLLFLLFFF